MPYPFGVWGMGSAQPITTCTTFGGNGGTGGNGGNGGNEGTYALLLDYF